MSITDGRDGAECNRNADFIIALTPTPYHPLSTSLSLSHTHTHSLYPSIHLSIYLSLYVQRSQKRPIRHAKSRSCYSLPLLACLLEGAATAPAHLHDLFSEAAHEVGHALCHASSPSSAARSRRRHFGGRRPELRNSVKVCFQIHDDPNFPLTSNFCFQMLAASLEVILFKYCSIPMLKITKIFQSSGSSLEALYRQRHLTVPRSTGRFVKLWPVPVPATAMQHGITSQRLQ